MTKRLDWEIPVDGNIRPFAVDLPFKSYVTTQLTLTTANTTYKLPATELTERRQIVLYNVSDTDMYVGASNVTTSTGILLPSGGNMSIASNSDLYAVCGTSSKAINILEMT